MLTTVKLAAQRLLKTPGFTLAALGTLAICLGANLAIFAVVDGIVLRPLPFPSADRLVLVSNSYPGAGIDQAGASIPNYFDRRHAIKAFASVSIYQESNVIVAMSARRTASPTRASRRSSSRRWMCHSPRVGHSPTRNWPSARIR